MPMCEKCWADAYAHAYHRGGSQVDRYRELRAERTGVNACCEHEQRGETAYCSECRNPGKREGEEA